MIHGVVTIFQGHLSFLQACPRKRYDCLMCSLIQYILLSRVRRPHRDLRTFFLEVIERKTKHRAAVRINLFHDAQNLGCRVAFRLYRKQCDVKTELLHDRHKICVTMDGIHFNLAFCVDVHSSNLSGFGQRANEAVSKLPCQPYFAVSRRTRHIGQETVTYMTPNHPNRNGATQMTVSRLRGVIFILVWACDTTMAHILGIITMFPDRLCYEDSHRRPFIIGGARVLFGCSEW